MHKGKLGVVMAMVSQAVLHKSIRADHGVKQLLFGVRRLVLTSSHLDLWTESLLAATVC